MRKILILLTLTFLSCSFVWAETDKVTYSFGIVPQQSAKKLAKLWTPLLKYVSEQSGVTLRFKTAKNIPEFEKRLAEGEYDFSYMNPYHFTVFNKDPGYQAVAVRKDQPIVGILVTQKDQGVQSIEELEGKNLAFPSPAAFAASILPRAMLKNKGIEFEKKYVSSHDSVYLNVAKKRFASGGGVMRTLNNTTEQVRDSLTVLWKSPGYTPHAIAAHPRIDADIMAKVQQVLVDMANSPESNKLLKKLKIKNGLIKAVNSDWDDVRSLGIELLED